MPDVADNLDEFFRAGPDLDLLEPANEPEAPAALERLGPSPFPKGKFPFLGFLATVYDHVSAHCRARTEK
ncbi:MAG TPA: hypothetical protein VG722_03250 [Tepidisphaeraceae bacterium]|nr:hypothetical protein [Tepidisphaeraceae bacterium]